MSLTFFTVRLSRFSYALLALLLLALLDGAGLNWLHAADRFGGDLLLRLHARSRPAPDNIVLLDIDQRSLESLQADAGAWPWPRAIHGELLAALQQQRPKAVVFDLLFNEIDRFRPDSDAFFNQQLAGTTPVYLPIARLPDGNPLPLQQLPATLGIEAGTQAKADAAAALLLPQALDSRHWRGGLINFLEDDDALGRRYWLYQSLSGWRMYSLPGQMARDFGWPLAGDDSINLNWYRPGSFRHVSYATLYQDIGREQRQRPADEFTDKIVVIGTTAAGLYDLRRTPLDEPLDDFFFDQSYRHVLGATRPKSGSTEGASAQVVNLDVRRKIADLPIAGMPHLGSGITFAWNGTTVLASPNLQGGAIDVVDMKSWKPVRTIATPGPGFFMRSHENTPFAWTDSMMSPTGKDTLTIIDKRTLEVVAKVREPGKTLAHIEFTKDGRYALASVWEMDGAVVVFDAQTFKEVKRLPMSKPVGKYNVWNKITRSEGTSH